MLVLVRTLMILEHATNMHKFHFHVYRIWLFSETRDLELAMWA